MTTPPIHFISSRTRERSIISVFVEFTRKTPGGCAASPGVQPDACFPRLPDEVAPMTNSVIEWLPRNARFQAVIGLWADAVEKSDGITGG